MVAIIDLGSLSPAAFISTTEILWRARGVSPVSLNIVGIPVGDSVCIACPSSKYSILAPVMGVLPTKPLLLLQVMVIARSSMVVAVRPMTGSGTTVCMCAYYMQNSK